MSAPPTLPAPPAPRKRIRRRPLRTLGDVRKALAAVCADLEASRIGPNQGRAIIYGLAVLSQVHQRSQGLPEDLFQEKGKDASAENALVLTNFDLDRLTLEQVEALETLIKAGTVPQETP